MDTVIIHAARLFGVPMKEITGQRRMRCCTEARFAVAAALRQRGCTLEEIGALLGGRDHTTIIHAIEQATARAADDAEYAQHIAVLVRLPVEEEAPAPPMPVDAPDYAFADALLLACARALRLVTPDEAAQMSEVRHTTPAPLPDAPVTMPFGCVRYSAGGRSPKIVPQMYIDGRKTGLGHYPYTPDGAAQAAAVRAAAVACKDAGGDAEAIRQAARAAREGVCLT